MLAAGRPRGSGVPSGSSVDSSSDTRQIAPRNQLLAAVLLCRIQPDAGDSTMAWADTIRTPLTMALATLGLVAFVTTHDAAAQERPGPAAEFTGAWMGFADDGIVNESLVGATIRWYLLPRVSIGPEIDYVHGHNHSHFIVTGNLTWDVVAEPALPLRQSTE
jgi:hypothetical protein